MPVRSLVLGAALCALACGASPAAAVAQAKAKPQMISTASPIFAEPSPLFLQAPQFDKIKDSDFEPALEAGMARQKAEITAIADNPAAPTFDNTIAAMERSGQMLDRVNNVFSALSSANTNDTLQNIETKESPRLAEHNDWIYLNAKLFARVQNLYDRRASLGLNAEQAQLLSIAYETFLRAGAKLSPADQAALKALNTRLSSLETAFGHKLLAATKDGALIVDDKASLAGLSDAEVAAAASDAEARGQKGKWALTLQNTTQQPLLSDLADRSVRERLFANSWTRAERGGTDDTRTVAAEIAQLRAHKAKLLGYPNWASYALADQMAKTPDAADAFMRQLAPPARARSDAEAAEIQKVIDAEGGRFDVKPWDWDRYSEKVRKARYDLDQDELKPYFELDQVLQKGVFFAANQLYGVTFVERNDLPVYQPDVRVFEVRDADGSVLGLIYFDYFKRDNKSGGAWMTEFVGQSKLLGTKPVVANVANFTKPAPGQPALISSDDVITMFHEFGHALHGLFADQTYPTLSGTNVARDFVEFPSQFNENWALDPKVLANYARHYKTGAPIPPALIDKIKASAKFNQGYGMGELIAAAELDMRWHELAADAPRQDVDQFEAQALKASGTDFPHVPPRYRSSYFRHIWSNGYAAGYYAYLWTQMLADDSWAWFQGHGGLTRENGQRFRDLILSRGHTLDYGPMFRAFYGKDPEIGPMLVHRGLAETQQ
jgi:peptidyl-dipeptidase Dcp